MFAMAVEQGKILVSHGGTQMTVPDVLIVICYLVIAGSHAAKYLR